MLLQAEGEDGAALLGCWSMREKLPQSGYPRVAEGLRSIPAVEFPNCLWLLCRAMGSVFSQPAGLYFDILPPLVNDGDGFCHAKQVRT